MSTTRLLRPTAASWLATLAALLGSLVRAKIFAVSLGTAGVGLTSQLTNLALLASSIGALGLGNAGVKLLAEARADGDQALLRRLVAVLVWLPLVAGLIGVVAVTLTASGLSSLLLRSHGYSTYLALTAVSVPVNLVAGAAQVVLQGHQRLIRLAADTLLAAVVMTVVAAVLTLTWGLAGAVASIPATSVGWLAVLVVRERWIFRLAWPPAGISGSVRRVFLTIGLASVAATAMTMSADLIARSYVVHRLGLAANGLYQPAYLMSTMVFGQFAAALTVVLMPSFAYSLRSGDTAEVNALVARAVRLGSLMVVPAVLVTMAMSPLAIGIVFSHSFQSAAPTLELQMIGEVARVGTYALGAVLLPAGLVRQWLTVGFVATAVRVSVVLVFLPTSGINALALSSCAEWLAAGMVTWVLVTRNTRVVCGRRELAIFWSGLVVAAAAYLVLRLPGLPARQAVPVLLAIVWLAAVTSAEERHRLAASAARAVRWPFRGPARMGH